jgi:hypothetical protein
VAGTSRDLRITLWSFDKGGSDDSWIPIFADLDLIVVGPKNEIYRVIIVRIRAKNILARQNGGIVFQNELVAGAYEIDV